jgi:hypothetical protein
MKRASAAGQLTDAMAIFDQLEKGFGGSASYPEAVELARQILPPLRNAVLQTQAQYKKRVETDKQRMLTAKGAERDQLAAILKNEKTKAETTVAAIEKSGVKWLPLQPATERSLGSLVSRATSETARLNGLRTEKMKESVQSAEAAEAALASGDVEGAEKALREASSAWSGNEMVKRLQPKLADLKKAASGAKQTAPKATPAPAPKRTPSASAPVTAPIVEDVPPPPTPFYKKPVFFIGVAIAVAFGIVAVKVFGKFRSAESNLLDQ